MKNLTIYDKSEEYRKAILPKVEEIKELCIKYDIPFIAVFATESSEKQTIYSMDGLMPGVKDITLNDNRLNNVFNMMSGYIQPDSVNYSDIEDDFQETPLE